MTLMPRLTITSYHGPDLRAEAAAMSIMTDAFSPQYGEAWTAAQLSGFTALPRVTLSLAHVDAAYMGFSLSRQVADEAELLLLAVSRQWRRRGVGQALLENCVNEARRSGVRTVHLEVRENNPAVGLYSAAGFENIHRRPSYYRGNDGSTYDALSYHLQT